MQVKEIFTEAAAGNKILTTFAFEKYLLKNKSLQHLVHIAIDLTIQFIHKQRSTE